MRTSFSIRIYYGPMNTVWWLSGNSIIVGLWYRMWGLSLFIRQLGQIAIKLTLLVLQWTTDNHGLERWKMGRFILQQLALRVLPFLAVLILFYWVEHLPCDEEARVLDENVITIPVDLKIVERTVVVDSGGRTLLHRHMGGREYGTHPLRKSTHVQLHQWEAPSFMRQYCLIIRW